MSGTRVARDRNCSGRKVGPILHAGMVGLRDCGLGPGRLLQPTIGCRRPARPGAGQRGNCSALHAVVVKCTAGEFCIVMNCNIALERIEMFYRCLGWADGCNEETVLECIIVHFNSLQLHCNPSVTHCTCNWVYFTCTVVHMHRRAHAL